MFVQSELRPTKFAEEKAQKRCQPDQTTATDPTCNPVIYAYTIKRPQQYVTKQSSAALVRYLGAASTQTELRQRRNWITVTTNFHDEYDDIERVQLDFVDAK